MADGREEFNNKRLSAVLLPQQLEESEALQGAKQEVILLKEQQQGKNHAHMHSPPVFFHGTYSPTLPNFFQLLP